MVNVSTLTKNENMKLSHKFNLNSTVKYNNENLIIDSEDSVKQRTLLNSHSFFVISQDRDCDGTPLYTLCTHDFKSLIEVEDYVIYSVIGEDVLLKLSKEQQLTLIHNTLKTIVFRGFSEDFLTAA